MPKAVDHRQEALDRLQARAADLEARSARKTPEYGMKVMAQGSRLVAALIGGPVMGMVLGGGIDLLAKTTPWGTIIGILLGFSISVYLAVRMAQAMSAKSVEEWGPPQPMIDEEDDDDQDR